MDKRTWTAVGLLSAAIGGVLIVWALTPKPHVPPTRLDAPPAPELATGPEEPVPSLPAHPPAQVAAPAPSQPQVGPSAAPTQPGEQLPTERELPPGDPRARPLPEQNYQDDLRHSNGWQLGQARRRVAMLERRINMFEANAQRLENEGHPEYAAQQRETITQLEEGLARLRERVPELEHAAQGDGTMGDVQQGWDEGEPGDNDTPVPMRPSEPAPAQ